MAILHRSSLNRRRCQRGAFARAVPAAMAIVIGASPSMPHPHLVAPTVNPSPVPAI